jgi:TonB family protein
LGRQPARDCKSTAKVDGANQVPDFPVPVRRGILTVVCSGVALTGAPLVRGQDATSANLPEHFDTGQAIAAPNPKKKKSNPQISSSASTENLPQRVPEELSAVAEPVASTPSKREKDESTPPVATAQTETPAAPTEPLSTTEETATPVARVQKKPRVRRRVQPAVQPEKSSAPVPASFSLSVAQSMAESAPLPEYPYEARHANVTGSGVCLMMVDPASGRVSNAVMTQSTGNAVLDKVTTETFRRWRFKPGTVSEVRVPISYE